MNANTSTDQSTQAMRRAARSGPGEGEAYWFYGDLAIVRSPEGALPVIIEHHIGSGGAAAQSRPELATLNFEAMNAVAGETGQPVLGPPMALEEAALIATRGQDCAQL